MCEPRQAAVAPAPTAATASPRRWRSRGRAAPASTSPTTGPPRRPPAGSTGSWRRSTPPGPPRATSPSTSTPIRPGARSRSRCSPTHVQEGGPQEILRRLEDAAERRDIAATLDAEEGPKLLAIVFSYLPAYAGAGGQHAARPRGPARPLEGRGALRAAPRAEPEGRLRRRAAGERGGLAAAGQGLHGAARPRRLHGLQRHHPGRQLPPSPLLRRLPALPRPPPPRARNAEPGGDGPSHDRSSRPGASD